MSLAPSRRPSAGSWWGTEHWPELGFSFVCPPGLRSWVFLATSWTSDCRTPECHQNTTVRRRYLSHKQRHNTAVLVPAAASTSLDLQTAFCTSLRPSYNTPSSQSEPPYAGFASQAAARPSILPRILAQRSPHTCIQPGLSNVFSAEGSERPNTQEGLHRPQCANAVDQTREKGFLVSFRLRPAAGSFWGGRSTWNMSTSSASSFGVMPVSHWRSNRPRAIIVPTISGRQLPRSSSTVIASPWRCT